MRLKKMLLVLDNCEHVVGGCSRLAADLIGACPRLRIIATSRRPLGIEEEMTWRAPPLAVPEPRRLPAAEEGLALLLPQYEASRLFMERAMVAMPAFRLTEQNSPAVVRIVRRLEGIPLAIELAASRVRALTAQQVAIRLDDRFHLLSHGSPETPLRHQTIEATIGWSYELLSEAQRSLLRRLAVFTGGWTLEAAEQTSEYTSSSVQNPNAQRPPEIQNEDVLDLLTDLIEQSLVVADEDVGGVRRYRMLESIREFALDRLIEADEEKAARDRHSAYFLASAEASDPHGKAELTASALDLVESDHANFRAALLHYYPAANFVRLTKSLFWFWNMRGYWTEGRVWLERAVDSYSARDSLRAALLNGLGIVAWRQGDYSAARRALEEGTEIVRQHGEHRSMASTLGNLGLVLCDLGDYAAAKACHAEALEIDQASGSPNTAARLCNLGLVEMYENDLDTAVEHFTAGIMLFREQGHRRGIATALANRGLVSLHRRDLQSAVRDNTEAAAICRDLSLKGILAFALHGLGMAAFYASDYQAAYAHYNESIQIRSEIADQKGLMDSLNNAGDLLLRYGHPYAAVRLWGAGDRLREKTGAAQSEFERSDYNDNLLEARRALGDPGFEAAWTEGRGLSLHQAIAEFRELAAHRK